jgi:hypothetical protein
MARSVAYREYLQRYRELQALLDLGRNVGTENVSSQSLAKEVAVARAIVVLLAGHLQAFFNSLGGEVLSQLPSDWNSLTLEQQRYVALCMAAEIQRCNADFRGETYRDAGKVQKLKDRVQRLGEWIETPDKVNSSEQDVVLQGFFKDVAPRSVDKFLRRFHPEDESFLDWVGRQGFDKSRIYTVLEQLVNQRNDVAHGSLETQPTLNDARLYIVTATTLVRLADKFIRGCYSYVGSP